MEETKNIKWLAIYTDTKGEILAQYKFMAPVLCEAYNIAYGLKNTPGTTMLLDSVIQIRRISKF